MPTIQCCNRLRALVLAGLDHMTERGVTTADGVEAVAAEMGYDPATFTRAANEWIARMGKSMVVGQQFRSHLGI